MKKTINLRWKILIYLSIFAISILLLIYLLQITFLQEFYTKSKIDELKRINYSIEVNLSNYKQNEFNDYLNKLSSNYNTSIIVFNTEKGQPTEIFTAGPAGSDLLNKTDLEIYQIVKLTSANNNEYLFSENTEEVIFDNEYFKIAKRLAKEEQARDYIYSRHYENSKYDAYVIVSSTIVPVNATVSTLKQQYLFIVIIVGLLTMVLALAISYKVVTPIQRINKQAKSLGKGEYKSVDLKREYTEIKELNETLINAKSSIQAAEKTKRDLIANVSHDLRTPLTMIGGYAEMMRDLPGENNYENANVIVEETKRLSFLVNDLLDFSKLEDNKILLKKETISITKLLKDIYKQYDKFIEKEGFSFNLEINDECNVFCDTKRIKQVLYNFINNAINYSSDNKYVLIRQSISNNKCLIEIIDKGLGISENKLNDIWDRYYKVDHEHIRSSIGSGIGLAISKEILEAHRVKYGVKSEINNGSTFYFELTIK